MNAARIKKAAYLLSGGLALLLAALAVELLVLPMAEAGRFMERLFLLALIDLNALALLALVFFVGKSFYGVYREWKGRELGYRFKTRVMAVFLTLIALPLGLLFLVSIGLGANYIERFFAPEFKASMESALEVAKSLYDEKRREVLSYARLARQGEPLPEGAAVGELEEMPPDATQAVRAAFAGREETEVISHRKGDIVRAAVPWSPGPGRGGVLVVEIKLPKDITRHAERISASYENYLKLETWKTPIKLNYLLILGFFTMVIIFSALWASLRVARWITEPVKNLARATREVAQGNLSVSVACESAKRADEMALLIDSFNTMVREMRSDKESLVKAYKNMENTVKNIRSGVISLDERGDVTGINAAACGILGVSEADVVGKFYPEVLANIRSEELDRFLKTIKIKELTAVEKEVRAAVGGAKAVLRVSVSGIKGSAGEHLGMLVVVDDLTELIKAQRALAWQEVARRMAHEIKNPLTPIQLSTERMRKKWREQDPEFGQVFEGATETVIREVNSLKRLVDEFSRLGKMPELAVAPTDVRAVVEEAVGLYRDSERLEVTLEAQDGFPHMELDGEQLKRAIINLIDNAREAMGGQGRVWVRLAKDPSARKALISVADEGPGIREEDRERLFLPYFSTKKDGTGLGLAIADKIAADHGGSIKVRDNVPKGSVFVIELPIKEV